MKHIGIVAGLTLALALAACSDDRSTGAASEPAAAAAASTDAEAVNFENNELRGQRSREFAYSWPAEVSAIPALVERFSAERDALLAEQRQEFEAALREFEGSDCLACTNRSFAKTWEVVADLPRFLSLSQSFSVYSGGAHGNTGSGALLWDREAGRALAPQDLFASETALQDALGPRWCTLLKAERGRRLGEDPGDGGIFPCPPIKDLTVLPGSEDKTHFDRIGLIADPYVAGSYAEGSYEVTIPVSEAVIAALKPEYRAYFARGT